MASPAQQKKKPQSAEPQPAARQNGGLGKVLAGLFSVEMLWLAWLPVLLIGVFHYLTGIQYHWVHDVLRRLYYVPILFAAFSRGLPGGLAVALVVTLTYIPHAFILMHGSMDPGTTVNKLMEMLLYNIIGVVTGLLADREAGRRRQVEQALAQQKAMAAQLVRTGRLAALGELVAGIAHEIKNPLHALKGTAEIVDEIIPRQADEFAMWTLHREELDRLEGISERFLSFARPGQGAPLRQPFGQIYARVAGLIKAQGHHSPEVQVEVAPLDARLAKIDLDADRDQIAQVMLNISSNGIKAMSEKGQLRLFAAQQQKAGRDFVRISLYNSGPHIAAEQLERIFDPFVTGFADGTGLGLSISERIAEAHGGFLQVQNCQERGGVQFDLLLPLPGAKGRESAFEE